ncbi:hypothetical protein B0A55_02219 [Friedmanniomyces simplex]|uniref:Uncharacterized protein n=1 Tax=Friedmanniomyces simplex TaxID=329884 RepID=A0A4U0XXG3_9PEZI|nr:hypothetical protein B0A55_02219 [Friedmanniomyces simplex]
MGAAGRKQVRFDLPSSASSSEMAVDSPLKSSLKKPAAAAAPAPSGIRDIVVQRDKSGKPGGKRKSSAAQLGRYELRNTKRTEYYGDGRKVTVYKKIYSYWP